MMRKSITMCIQKATLHTLHYVQHPLLHGYKFSTSLLLKTTLIQTLLYTYLYIYSKKVYPPPAPPPPHPSSVVGILNCYGLDGLRFKPRCERDFQDPSRMAPRPAQSPVWWGRASAFRSKNGRSLVLISHYSLSNSSLHAWHVTGAAFTFTSSNTKVTYAYNTICIQYNTIQYLPFNIHRNG
jgi:hypothetical protein